MKKNHLFFTIMGLFFSINMLIAQTTIELTPSKYNTLYQEANKSNALGDHIFVGNNNANLARRTLMSFDLTSIPSGVDITKVTLKMHF